MGAESSEDGERRKAFSLKYVEQGHAEALVAKQAVISFAQSSIRMLFVTNGGAIIALLTFMGALYGRDSGRGLLVAQALAKALPAAMGFYLAGLVFSVLAAGVAYLNFSMLDAVSRSPEALLQWSRGEPIEDASALMHRSIFGSA